MTASSNHWHIRIGEKVYGPYQAGQIKQLVQQGKIKPDTLIKQANSDQWVVASSYPSLFAAAPTSTSAPATPASSAPATPAPQTPSTPATPTPTTPIAPTTASQPTGSASDEPWNDLGVEGMSLGQPMGQPRPAPRPQNQVKTVVVGKLDVKKVYVNVLGYMILAMTVIVLVCDSIIGIGTLFLGSAIASGDSPSDSDVASGLGGAIFMGCGGMGYIVNFFLVIAIVVFVVIVWQSSQKTRQGNAAMSVIACVGIGAVLGMANSVASAIIPPMMSAFVGALAYSIFYGFVISIAFMLAKWQSVIQRFAMRSVVWVTGGLVLASCVPRFAGNMLGANILDAESSFIVLSVIVGALGTILFVAGSGLCGFSLLKFAKQMD